MLYSSRIILLYFNFRGVVLLAMFRHSLAVINVELGVCLWAWVRILLLSPGGFEAASKLKFNLSLSGMTDVYKPYSTGIKLLQTVNILPTAKYENFKEGDCRHVQEDADHVGHREVLLR